MLALIVKKYVLREAPAYLDLLKDVGLKEAPGYLNLLKDGGLEEALHTWTS
jgi:hypothetical protein